MNCNSTLQENNLILRNYALIPFLRFCCLTICLVVVSYSASFCQYYQWAKGIGGAGDESAGAIASDAFGNVYICGHFTGTIDIDPGPGTTNLVSAQLNDIFFAKYNSLGNLDWAKVIAGNTPNHNELAFNITLDSVGNIYLIGKAGYRTDLDPGPDTFFFPQWQFIDYFFAKYDGNGNFQWAKGIRNASNSAGGHLQSIRLDKDGNIFICGYLNAGFDFDPDTGKAIIASTGGIDIFFAKYNGSGNYLWVKSIGSTGDESPYGIASDAAGSVYIGGSFSDTVDFNAGAGTAILSTSGNSDMFITKYDGSGNYLWAKGIGGIGYDECKNLAVDYNGNVYLTGFFSDIVDFDAGPGTASMISAGSQDAFIAKYNSSGDYQWVRSAQGLNQEFGIGIVVDMSGSIYSTGLYSGSIDFDPGPAFANLTSAGNQDIFFAKFDSGGNYQWARSIGGFGDDHIQSIAEKTGGNLYLTGKFSGTAYFYPGHPSVSLTAAGSQDIFIAKYNSDPTTVTDLSQRDENIHIYPNPNYGSFNIQLPDGQNYEGGKIEIYNSLGEMVRFDQITGSR